MSAFRAHSREVAVASEPLLTKAEQESTTGRASLDYMHRSNAVSAERIVPFADQALPVQLRRETRVGTPDASPRRVRRPDRAGRTVGLIGAGSAAGARVRPRQGSYPAVGFGFAPARPRAAPLGRLEPAAVRVPCERLARVVRVELAAPALPRERLASVDGSELATVRPRADRVAAADALRPSAFRARPVVAAVLDERRGAPEGVSAPRSLSKSLSIRLLVRCASRRSALAVRTSSL